MSEENLHTLLRKLKKELSDLDANSVIRKEVNSLITDIELKLKLQEVSLTENIRDNIEKFEDEHPKVTAILREIMIKLVNIGI